MKTSISIPDPVFEVAESLASDLGMTRSEFFTKAVSDYIESQKYNAVTAKLNTLYSKEATSLDSNIAKMQYKSIGHENLWAFEQ